jgi:hypothetical protein
MYRIISGRNLKRGKNNLHSATTHQQGCRKEEVKAIYCSNSEGPATDGRTDVFTQTNSQIHFLPLFTFRFLITHFFISFLIMNYKIHKTKENNIKALKSAYSVLGTRCAWSIPFHSNFSSSI